MCAFKLGGGGGGGGWSIGKEEMKNEYRNSYSLPHFTDEKIERQRA